MNAHAAHLVEVLPADALPVIGRDLFECADCQGQGVIYVPANWQRGGDPDGYSETRCDHCSGSGRVPVEEFICRECGENYMVEDLCSHLEGTVCKDCSPTTCDECGQARADELAEQYARDAWADQS